MKKMKVLWQRSDFAFLAMVGVALLVLFGVIFVPPFSSWVVELLGEKDKQEVIKFIGWGVAGILAFFGAIAVNRRADAQVKIAESQLESAAAQSRVADAQFKNNELVERGHIQERFKAAVEHLGSDKVSARISSFYEFSYLARDNEDLRRNIFDILCAHLRQTTADKKYKEEVGFVDKRDNSEVRPTEEVQSLLDVLFQKGNQEKLIFEGFVSNLQRTFLMGAKLHKANLRGAVLRYADLRGAGLQEADLQKVMLWCADLRGADLQWADLQEANLTRTKLQKAFLRGADLRYARLFGTELEGAGLQGTDLRDANLQMAYLWNANLQDADLRGADLRHVMFLDKLSGAKVKGAKLPEGFEWPADADTTSDD